MNRSFERLSSPKIRTRVRDDTLLCDYLIARFNEPKYVFTPKERALYFKALLRVNGLWPVKCAEIGVWTGENLSTMARVFGDTAELYGVDPYVVFYHYTNKRKKHRAFQPKWNQYRWEKFYEKVKDGLEEIPNVRLLRTESEQGVWFVPDNLNFVYIDAGHDYHNVINDITLWEEKATCGAVIAGHDYNGKKYGQVTMAVNDYAKIHGRVIHNPSYAIWWWYKE